MSEPKEPGYNPQTGIRLPSDEERTPEYLAERGEFVRQINDWLEEIKKTQEAGRELDYGGFSFPVSDEPRINQTILQAGSGSTGSGNGRGLRKIIETTVPGISLQGDGYTSPLVLQAVVPYRNGRMVVIVTGRDPLSPVDEEGRSIFAGANSRSEASLLVRREYPTDDGWASGNEDYVCKGNGQMDGAGAGISGTMPDDAEKARFVNVAAADIMGQFKILHR